MSAEFIPALPLARLPPGTMRPVSVSERDVLLCHTHEGVVALDDVCSPAYARLHAGRLRGIWLIGPLHGASFDVRHGRVPAPPAPQPLTPHAVRIRAGIIEVALHGVPPACRGC